MFLLKSLSDKFKGTEDTGIDKVKLSGELYQQIRQSTIRNITSECIYLDSLMTIQKTTRKNYYNLVVTRVFEEGEDELENEDSEEELNDDYYEKVFLITENLRFVRKVWEHDDKKQVAFFWLDKSNDNKTARYIFVPNKESEESILNFEKAVYQCVYESINNNEVSADDENLIDFIEDYRKKSFVYNTEEEVIRNGSINELQQPETSNANSQSASNNNVNKTSASKQTTTPKIISSLQKDLSVNSEGYIYSKSHNIFKYDTNESEFRLIASNTSVVITKIGSYDYLLKVEGDVQVEKKIDSNMNEAFNH